MGMKEEIDAALHAHAAWRKRFKDFLSGHGAFDTEAASASDRCDFGRWLAREGHRLMPPELHERICEAHAEFHRIAGGIVENIKQRQFDAAHRAIAPDGALNLASAQLGELMRKASLHEGGASPSAPPPAQEAPPQQDAGAAAPPADTPAQE